MEQNKVLHLCIYLNKQYSCSTRYLAHHLIVEEEEEEIFNFLSRLMANLYLAMLFKPCRNGFHTMWEKLNVPANSRLRIILKIIVFNTRNDSMYVINNFYYDVRASCTLLGDYSSNVVVWIRDQCS